jgi:hypothetical protein
MYQGLGITLPGGNEVEKGRMSQSACTTFNTRHRWGGELHVDPRPAVTRHEQLASTMEALGRPCPSISQKAVPAAGLDVLRYTIEKLNVCFT